MIAPDTVSTGAVASRFTFTTSLAETPAPLLAEHVTVLDFGRCTLSAGCVGGAKRALEMAIARAK